MGRRRKTPESIVEQVRRRANYLCEYCHPAEQWQYVPFSLDHVIPLAHGGKESLDNLSLACFHCNRRKSDLTEALDPTTGEIVPLFNPRLHSWSDHFTWSADKLRIIGLTPTGLATIERLGLNRERVVRLRAADLLVDRHPPKGDPVQEPD